MVMEMTKIRFQTEMKGKTRLSLRRLPSSQDQFIAVLTAASWMFLSSLSGVADTLLQEQSDTSLRLLRQMTLYALGPDSSHVLLAYHLL
jgi:hypothetical protein